MWPLSSYLHDPSGMYKPDVPLERWPLLSELTVTYTEVDIEWYLETYSVEGPVMNSVPSDDCHWHKLVGTDGYTAEGGAPVHDQSNEGALYYQAKGIKVDPGIRWLLDKYEAFFTCSFWARLGQKGSSTEVLELHSTPAGLPNNWDYRPNIGLRGFHKNQTSCGGMWAGFRYFPGATPPRLEFSPLAWEDVQAATFASQNSHGKRGVFPKMVIKVFVVRQGDVAPDVNHHCCWEEVIWEEQFWEHEQTVPTEITHYECLEELDRIRIKMMWNMVCRRLDSMDCDLTSYIFEPSQDEKTRA